MLAARAAKGDEEGGCAEALEETLQQVSLLASDLALTNVTETVGFSAKRSARQLWGGARASVAFCSPNPSPKPKPKPNPNPKT